MASVSVSMLNLIKHVLLLSEDTLPLVGEDFLRAWSDREGVLVTVSPLLGVIALSLSSLSKVSSSLHRLLIYSQFLLGTLAAILDS